MLSLCNLAARLSLIAPFAALAVVGCEREPPTIGVLATIEVTRNPHISPVTTSRGPVSTGTDTRGSPPAVAPVWSIGAGGVTMSVPGYLGEGAAPGTWPSTNPFFLMRTELTRIEGHRDTVTNVTRGPLAVQ
jgi:hypothetical protein